MNKKIRKKVISISEDIRVILLFVLTAMFLLVIFTADIKSVDFEKETRDFVDYCDDNYYDICVKELARSEWDNRTEIINLIEKEGWELEDAEGSYLYFRRTK